MAFGPRLGPMSPYATPEFHGFQGSGNLRESFPRSLSRSLLGVFAETLNSLVPRWPNCVTFANGTHFANVTCRSVWLLKDPNSRTTFGTHTSQVNWRISVPQIDILMQLAVRWHARPTDGWTPQAEPQLATKLLRWPKPNVEQIPRPTDNYNDSYRWPPGCRTSARVCSHMPPVVFH